MKKAMIYILIFAAGLVLIALFNIWQVLHPQKIYVNDNPANYGLQVEEIALTTADNVKLSAWYIENVKGQSENGKGEAVILLHGYPAEKSDLLPLAHALSSDFSVLLIDFRYFGKSEGDKSTLGYQEVLDVKAGVDFLEDRGVEKIGVYGFSLGGATAIMAAEQDSRISAVASHSAFADLLGLADDLYANLFILKKPMIWMMSSFSELLFKVSPKQISPQSASAKLTIPVFVIHSRQDDQIPFSNALKLEQALKNNPAAQFYFYDAGLHGELPLDLDSRIKEFFLKALK